MASETFSQDAVTVLLSDDLRRDAHRCVSDVLQFLGVPEAVSLAGGYRRTTSLQRRAGHGRGL